MINTINKVKTLFLILSLILQAFYIPLLSADESCEPILDYSVDDSYEKDRPLQTRLHGELEGRYTRLQNFGGESGLSVDSLSFSAASKSVEVSTTIKREDGIVIKNESRRSIKDQDGKVKITIYDRIQILRCDPPDKLPNIPPIRNNDYFTANGKNKNFVPQTDPELIAFADSKMMTINELHAQVKSEMEAQYGKLDFQHESSLQVIDEFNNSLNQEKIVHNELGTKLATDARPYLNFLPRYDKGSDFLTPASSPEGKKLEKSLKKLNQTRENLKSKEDYKVERENLLELAEIQLHMADTYYAEGDSVSGDDLLAAFERTIDIATDFAPGISMAKDLISLATGANPITGEMLSDNEKLILIAGLIAPGALKAGPKWIVNVLERLGFLSKLKEFPTLKRYADFVAITLQRLGESLKTGIEGAKDFLSAASKYGVKSFTQLKILKYLYQGLKKLPEHLTPVSIHYGDSLEKVVVVGRGMDATVFPTKKVLKAEGITIKTFDEVETDAARMNFKELKDRFNGQIPYDEVKNTLSYQENKDWLIGKIKDGYTVINIGNPAGLPASAFYDLEMDILRGLTQ